MYEIYVWKNGTQQGWDRGYHRMAERLDWEQVQRVVPKLMHKHQVSRSQIQIRFVQVVG